MDRWVWDVRSFWTDQRIAMGLLRRGSPTERVLRRVERAAARRASAVTALTRAAIDELERRHDAGVASRSRVITTCVDLDRFALTPMPDGPVALLLSGSFNPLYDFETMARFTRRVDRLRTTRLTLLRPSPTPWDDAVVELGGRVGSAAFDDMPIEVAAHHAGLAVCRTDDAAAIVAAMPTKVGEFLACGRPVVVNAGLGDLDALLPDHGAGVVIRGDLDAAARALLELLDDPATSERCRALAESHFDLGRGVDQLLDTYRRISSEVIG